VAVDPILIIGAAAVGLCLGSFLNVCILRLWHDDPMERSLLHPPSTCPHCKQRIAWRDNIPLFSWLWLRGKCRWCRKPISIQYPIIEATVALLWVVSLLYYGPSAKAIAAAVFGTILLGIGVIDARHKVIPDELSLGGLVLGLAFSLAGGFSGFLQGLLGATTGWAVLWVVRVVGGLVLQQEAMGWGDVKMLAMVGAFAGWRNALLTIFVGAVFGTMFYLPLMVAGIKRWRRYELPFGVFLAVAAAVTFVAGDFMISWYLDYLKTR
jgi:leader peptidase (prepilin peptidase)/N-methyltransferase